MKKLLFVLALALAGYLYLEHTYQDGSASAPASAAQASVESGAGDSDARIAEAFARHESNVQVSGRGVAARLLPDDTSGRRHQRFILRLSSGQTLLVAHNIDLAPRIASLREGDAVEFLGEYEWNEKGGVLHWTHRDPKGGHAAGWLKHQGKVYQ